MSSTTMLNGLPLWVRAVAVVGFPVLVASYLMLAVTGAVPSAISKEHETIQTKQEKAREEQEKVRQEQSQLLRLICANTAKSEAVTLECLRSR